MAYEPGAPHSVKIIDTEICSAKIKAEHPELFHYTGRGGFEPIVKTNTLWATHFRHLNDDAEISTLRPQLLDTMAAVLGEEVNRHNAGIRNQYYRHGGARPIARDFVASLYTPAFERSDANFAVDAYPWLGIKCSRCQAPRDVDLYALRHVPTTCVHDLAGGSCVGNAIRLRITRLRRCSGLRHASAINHRKLEAGPDEMSALRGLRMGLREPSAAVLGRSARLLMSRRWNAVP